MRKIVQYPTREPRAIVSVAFPKQDFEPVSLAAGRAGMKLSEFIRVAALAAAAGPTVSWGEPATCVSGLLRFRLT